MARPRRFVRPGSLVHIIVRFVNHEYLLDSREERHEYLRRAGAAFERTDWKALSYALMSTHTHFAAIAGEHPFDKWSRPLHDGFVGWLNPRRGRLGAAIANRPTTRETPLEACGRLIAYHHNNPVRAGVVKTAGDSDWTSHLYYTRHDAPSWLHTELGLRLSGFEPSDRGRQAFAEFVDGARDDDLHIPDGDLRAARREARKELGPAIEIGHAKQHKPTQVLLYAPASTALRHRWRGSLNSIAGEVCRRCAIDLPTLRASSRSTPIVAARRTFLIVAITAGFTLTESAAYLAISVQAASKSVQRADQDIAKRAQAIAERLRITKSLG